MPRTITALLEVVRSYCQVPWVSWWAHCGQAAVRLGAACDVASRERTKSRALGGWRRRGGQFLRLEDGGEEQMMELEGG